MTNKLISSKKTLPISAALAVFFLGLTSRPGITSIGSISARIHDDGAGLSLGAIGLLTTLPILCFGLFPLVVNKITYRIGYNRTVYSALSLMFVGFLVRMLNNNFCLFAGTIIIGLSITVINVILPSYVKTYYSANAGILTSLYFSSLSIGPAMATELTLRATNHYHSWLVGINVWIILIPIAWIAYLIGLHKKQESGTELYIDKALVKKETVQNKKNVLKSPLTWSIAFFFAFQCILFFTTVAWLTMVLINRGETEYTANRLLLLFDLISIPVTLLLGPIIFKTVNQLWCTISGPALYIFGILMILMNSNPPIAYYIVAVCCLGIGNSLCGTVGFSLPILRSKEAETTLQVSAIAQTVGFTFAAIGPTLAGIIQDKTNNWNSVLIFLALAGLATLLCGIYAGRDKTID